MINAAGSDCRHNLIISIGIGGGNTHNGTSGRNLVTAGIDFLPAYFHAILFYDLPESALISDVSTRYTHIPHRITRVRINIFVVGLNGLQYFTFVSYGTVAVTILHTVDIKSNFLILRISLDIDRIIRIVHKFEIFSRRFCYGCIRGRAHVSYNHGMMVSVRDIQFG